MGSRILIVDDEPELLRALFIRLTAAGFTCEAATDGTEALAKIQQRCPDLILTDLVMSDMDGYEMCRQLKSNQRTAAIPVVVLTAVPARALNRHAEHLGAACIMHKPFDSAELLTTVRDILAKTGRGGADHG